MSDHRESDNRGTPVEEILGRGIEAMPGAARDRIRHNVVSQVGWSAPTARFHETFVRAAALFTAMAVGLGSVGYASASSLPGSSLYPLKRAMEEMRIALIVRAPQRSDALMDITRARAQEVERLIEADAPDDVVEEAAGHFGDAAARTVESEDTAAKAQQRTQEIEAEVEAAPPTVRERVSEEVPTIQPDPDPDPPQSPQDPSGPQGAPGSGAPNSDGTQPQNAEDSPGAPATDGGTGDDTGQGATPKDGAGSP